MELKKRSKKAFLDGANLNLNNSNTRSQGTNLSWLNPASYGLKAQKLQINV